MADPLSIVASSFAVVGIADVVLRASVECCRFLSDIKDAPAEIDRPRTCIKENTQLVDSLMKHSDDLREPASSMSLSANDSSSVLDGLNSSIRALHRELNALRAVAKRHSGVDKTWGRFKWLLDERKISKSLERLERSKSMLSVVLSLVEGKRSASSQKNLDVAVKQDFERITSTMDSQLQELSIIRETQEKVRLRQEEVILHSTRQFKKTGLLGKDLLKASRTDQIEHAKTRRKIADGNQKVISTITSKLDELCVSIPKVPFTAKMSNRKINYIGERRESILTPLVLMKDHVRWAILHILSHPTERVSPQQLHWLQSEFDRLVSSATQEAASFCQGSTATSFDQWNYFTRENSLSNTAVPIGPPIASNDCEDEGVERTTAGSCGAIHQRKFRLEHEVFSSSSMVGQLHLTVPRTSNVGKSDRDINEARLSFIPSKGICSNSISARFVKFTNSGLEPRLYTQLNAFRLVEDEGPHIQLFRHGSIEDIDAAFRSGIISPYDQDYEGSIISCYFASRYLRPEVLQYLDSQGVGLSNLNGELDALHGFWGAIQGASSILAPYASFAKMKAYLGGQTPTYTFSTNGSVFHIPPWMRARDMPDKHAQLIKTWMEVLAQNDYFDLQDTKGRTVLLRHLQELGVQNLTTVRQLLEIGANPHAVDHHGRNAIYFAMRPHSGGYLPKILEEKLSLLIETGVDIHHRDKSGATPSYYARRYYCWAMWCRALERNGRKIDEVVREDGGSWLLEESSEERRKRRRGAR